MSVEFSSEYGFEYKVSVNITLTVADIRLIKRTAESHYDHNCRCFFEVGERGNYWRNQFRVGEGDDVDYVDPWDESTSVDLVSAPIKVNFNDIDRVSKILEMAYYDREGDNAGRSVSLRIQFKKVIIAIQDESKRLHDSRPDPAENAA
jgi:hypothetical protein